MSLEEKIKENAKSFPNKTAIICGSQQVSYGQLWESILEMAARLRDNGLKEHRPFVFRASQDIDFVATYCAIHLLNAIAVPLEHAVSEEAFQKVKSEVEACSYELEITDILYTTGTSGNAKGVLLSQTCLSACADNFISEMNFHHDLVFIVSGPLNHIASLFKIHPILIVGGTLCILNGLRDMNSFFQVFSLPYRHFATFLVPASIRMILQFSDNQLRAVAPLIDFIETGAAPISRDDMKHLSTLLPNSRLYNTYGGTEIGCVCTYQFNDGRYMEGCIGRPMRNSNIQINEDGGIEVSGKTIMSGYVDGNHLKTGALHDGKIFVSDMGYVDNLGLIHLTGRIDDIINVGGYKVDPVEVENKANELQGISDCICISSAHPILGNVLKLLYIVKDGFVVGKRDIAMHLKSCLENYKIPQEYQQVKQINLTYNGKKDRKSYKL